MIQVLLLAIAVYANAQTTPVTDPFNLLQVWQLAKSKDTLISDSTWARSPQLGDELLSMWDYVEGKPNAHIFTLKFGGCLRGPLQFTDHDGKVLFNLEAGVHYPTGCEKQ